MSRRIVGIFVALSAEARALTGGSAAVREVVPLADHVLLWIGGVGSAAAGRGCEALIAAGAEALASVGTAAGLATHCTPGTLVIPDQIVVPGESALPVSPAWRTALGAALEGEVLPVSGSLVEATSVLGPKQKMELYQGTGAVAADMESAAVARVTKRSDLPMIAVRAISDGRLDAVPAGIIETVDAFGRPRYVQLFARLVSQPQALKSVLGLAAGFRSACQTLRAVVRCAGPRFCCPD